MCELVLAEVNTVLERAKSVSIDISLVTKEAKNPAVLKSVGDITYSIVSLDPTGDKVSCQCYPIFVAPQPNAYHFSPC